MNKKRIIFIIVGIIVLVGVFYGGMSYGQSKTKSSNTTTSTGGGQFSRGGRGGGAGGFTVGQIISKNNNSITVQLMNVDPTSTTSPVGSKIVFVDGSATITKTTIGSLNDLAIGTQVSVTGTPNSDGSITASSVQIRPQMNTNTSTQ
jgi:hypothetical protein